MNFFLNVIFLVVITVVINTHVYCQENVNCYISTTDYIENNVYGESVKANIREISDSHIKIRRICNTSTGKKDKLATFSWAIRYKESNYLNLRYSKDFQNLEVYVKPLIEGKICVVVINNDSHKTIKTGGINYGGGLQGVLMKDADKWGKNWKDEKGKNQKILIFNTTKLNAKNIRGHTNATALLLTKKNVNDELNLSLNEKEIKMLTYESLLALIKEFNARV